MSTKECEVLDPLALQNRLTQTTGLRSMRIPNKTTEEPRQYDPVPQLTKFFRYKCLFSSKAPLK